MDTGGVIKAWEVCYVPTVKLSGYVYRNYVYLRKIVVSNCICVYTNYIRLTGARTWIARVRSLRIGALYLPKNDGCCDQYANYGAQTQGSHSLVLDMTMEPAGRWGAQTASPIRLSMRIKAIICTLTFKGSNAYAAQLQGSQWRI